MSKNRLFSVLIAIAVIVAAGLTVREAFATAGIVSRGNTADTANSAKCTILPTQMSIETVFEEERGMWVTYSAGHPAGVDGGLMDLLRSYPICSR